MQNKTTALIVDDEADIRELIEMSFMGIGIQCILSPTIADAIKQLKKETADFVITDMRLPDGDGLNLIAHIQKNYPNLPVCMITAHGNMELAVKALKLGAFDFVSKPFDLKQLRNMAKAALKLVENDKTPAINSHNSKTSIQNTDNQSCQDGINLIGSSPVMKKLEIIIQKLARSQAPVFIHGESGTGKELVARSIHAQSARKDGPFIPVNCGAIPENLVESEFFGYKKGSFTGAVKDSDGLFSSANKGTLFLDEVADLPLAMQVKLLRAIQERAIRPIGGDAEIPIDIRILSATHKDLSKLVEQGEFREDLYYRLNVISLGMPPLRKRTGDIPLLAKFIIKKLSHREETEAFTFTDEALEKLNQYDFPGNVRELENILERATTFCDDYTITAKDIHFTNNITSITDEVEMMNFDLSDGLDTDEEIIDHQPSEDKSAIGNLNNYMKEAEKTAILSALAETDNDKIQAAEKLGISPVTFRNKLKKYNLQ
ncbi:MAG: sigma-54-dependent Fis family transcriptional regulator [Gammaproteobacteria bacterium]|nr:sigma-54-dependent Fis family transcriptional regulator [Gammaproteobacteria bacterium]